MKPRSRVRLFVFATLAAAGAVATAFMGCIPGYTFGEAAGGDGGGGSEASATTDASTDGTVDATAPQGDSSPPGDAPSDSEQDTASPVFDGGIVSAAIIDAGSRINSTGYGYQLHLVYAANDKSYWLFYVDDTAGQIKTLHSSNFTSWVGGAAIPITAVADGYSFSVAYANLGGHDVVHLVINESGSAFATFHVRATISGGALTAAGAIALPNSSNGGACPQDGPATAVTPDGHVYDVTAWNDHGADGTTCDTDVYLAPGLDLGTSWNAGTFGYDGYYVSEPDIAFAHDLVTMPEAGTVMLLFPDQDNNGTINSAIDFLTIGWALSPSFHGGAPGDVDGGVRNTPADELFGSGTLQASYDDWSACRLTDSDIHLVRHVLASNGASNTAFDEMVYNGSAWQPTSSPPATSLSLSDTGVALVSGTDPTKGMLLATIGNDFAINVDKWTSAGGWTPLAKLPANGNARQSLAGSGCGSARPTLLWTETIGPANVIESADVSGFLK